MIRRPAVNGESLLANKFRRIKTFGREDLKNKEELEQLAAQSLLDAAASDAVETSTDPAPSDSAPEQFMEEERRAHGGVLAAVYWQYIKAAGLRWWICLA